MQTVITLMHLRDESESVRSMRGDRGYSTKTVARESSFFETSGPQ